MVPAKNLGEGPKISAGDQFSAKKLVQGTKILWKIGPCQMSGPKFSAGD